MKFRWAMCMSNDNNNPLLQWMQFHYFSIFPFEKSMILYLNKRHFLKSRDALQLTQWFRNGNSIKMPSMYFRNYLRLEKGFVLHLKKKWTPLNPRMICTKVGWNCVRVGIDKKRKKLTQQTAKCDQKSSLELSCEL